MRGTILFWSTASGVILGLFTGLLLFAIPVIGLELTAGVIPRLGSRAKWTLAVVAFGLLPLAGAALGLLEGRLKLR